jgi:hypothetical protein
MKLILSFLSNYLVWKLVLKSDFFGKSKEVKNDYKKKYSLCELGTLPFKYLDYCSLYTTA